MALLPRLHVHEILTMPTNNIPPLNQGAYGLYTSLNAPLGPGPYTPLLHHLGVTPRRVRVVVICEIADQGYVAGDEIEALCCYDDSSGSPQPIAFYGANSTVIYLFWNNDYSASSFKVFKTDGTGFIVMTPGHWGYKIYADAV